MRDIAGLKDWQWIFLLEGLPIILLGIITYLFLGNIPDTVQWLSNSEKELLTNILRDDAGMTNGETDSGSRVSWRQVRYVIMDWRIYLYVLIGIGLLSAMQCLTLFLPSLFDDKFNDNKLLTAITFSRKYYPKDNAFTDKFSLLLANGLRRFNVHQIVRITTFAAKNQYSKFSVVT
ncbi:unnamed protein product [Rotaria sp. Silwood2]|nr:unnamed protein product [Rotaria sp. Silwood2]CAF3412173.1 unnamed protein product [Rotaria sp. Silwood2]